LANDPNIAEAHQDQGASKEQHVQQQPREERPLEPQQEHSAPQPERPIARSEQQQNNNKQAQ
jgi:hypothetical protein